MKAAISCLFLIYFCVCAFAAPVSSLTKTSYSLVKPNEKNFVYNDRTTSISVTVGTTAFAQNDPLSLSFFTAENVTMSVDPTSSCVDANQNEIFTLTEGTLVAKSTITTTMSCTYAATIAAITANHVFTKLSMLSTDTLPEVTPLKTSSAFFQGYWSLPLPRVGDMNVLTIESDIHFAQGDTFVITANNGSPFASATACTDGEGTPLFTVAAQGSRLLLSARQALEASFSCQATIIVAASGPNNRNFVFSAPAHGLTSNSVAYFISFLDSATNFIRIGTYGVYTKPTVPNTTDNTLYLAIPASALRAGDTIKLHSNDWYGLNIASCKYKNGAMAGAIKYTAEYYEYLYYANYGLSMTLASPLQVNAQNYVELFCPITIIDPGNYGLVISAVSMPKGIFAATGFESNAGSLNTYRFGEDGVAAWVTSFHAGMNMFGMRVTNYYGMQNFVETDVTLRGVKFADAADVASKCTFSRDSSVLAEPIGMTLVAGEMRLQFDSKNIIDEGSIDVECVFPAVAGTYLSVYDNISQREATKEHVHAGTSVLSFGDGIQTHWMSADAVAGGVVIPFQLNVQNLYSESATKRSKTSHMLLQSAFTKIVYPAGKSSFDMTCSAGSAEGERSEALAFLNGFYNVTQVQFTMRDGYSAVCTGTAMLSSYPNPPPSLNTVTVDMTLEDAAYIRTVEKSQQSLKTPVILSPNEFSFYSGSVVLGVSASFSVGHTLLAKDNEVTFAFDHPITTIGSNCTSGDVSVLSCAPVDAKSFKCTKQDVTTTAACSLSVTFESDFARVITATATFTGLPNSVVFNPTFKIAADAPAMSADSAATKYAGQDMDITYTLPRAPTKGDVLVIHEIDAADSRLEFVRFEPRTSAAADTIIKVEDGMTHVSLDLLNTTAATTTNFKVIMRHVPKLNFKGEVPIHTVEASLNGKFALPSVSAPFTPSALKISAVPSAFTTLFSVVKIDHPDMVTDDSFTLNGFTSTGNIVPELRCDGVAVVTMAGNKFTLTAAVPAGQPCYLVLQSSYTLTNNVWSVTATTAASGTTTVYATGPAAAAAAPKATTKLSVMVKNESKNITLTLPDFTTALAPADKTAFEFSYDTTKMTVGAFTCASIMATINGGKVTVTFQTGTVPLASYGPMTCSIPITPLAAVAAPVFTGVALFGTSLTDIALPVFQDAYASKLTFTFPDTPMLSFNTVKTLSFIFDQLAPVAGSYITFRSDFVAGQLFTITGCGSSTYFADVIVLGSDGALSDSCTFSTKYVYTNPLPIIVTLSPPQGGVATTFSATAPPSYSSQQSTAVTLVSTTADTLTYRISRTTIEEQPVTTLYFENRSASPDVTLESDCMVASTMSTFSLKLNPTQEPARYTCEFRFVFKSAYNPDVVANRLYVYTYPDYNYVYPPAMKGTAPTVQASFAQWHYVFSFANTDSATVQIENVWGVVATSANPVKVRPLADDSIVAGNAVTSTDGRTLTVTFLAAYDGLKKENNKYSVDVCFLDIPAIYGMALQTTAMSAKFTVGSTSTTAVYYDTYISIDDAVTEAILTPESKYEIALHMYLASNYANLVLDYKNTALVSVDNCIGTNNDNSTVPVTFVTKASSISIAIAENDPFFPSGDGMYVKLKCMFNTATAAAIEKKVGPFAKTIVVAVKGANGADFFSAPVPVAIPFVAPKIAVSQVLSFTRSTLFTSAELAALAKQYASGLRNTVSALLDSQIVITGQKLVAVNPTPKVVPSRIATQFALAADSSVEVTFTSTPSTDAPITTADVTGASTDITAAFSGYTVTANAAEEALVDGECATRCGLGCALCVEGAACSADADCIEGHCNISGVCGAEPTPDTDNAASSVTVSVAVVAVIVATLMF